MYSKHFDPRNKNKLNIQIIYRYMYCKVILKLYGNYANKSCEKNKTS